MTEPVVPKQEEQKDQKDQKVCIKIDTTVKKKPTKKEAGELSDYKIKIPNDDLSKVLKEVPAMPTFAKSKSYTPSTRPSSKKRKTQNDGPLSTIAQYPEETPYNEAQHCDCDCMMQDGYFAYEEP